MTIPAPTLRPGDPPPFWDGLWHPEGKTEGAVMVKPLMTGSPTLASAPVAPASMPAAPEATVVIPQAAPQPPTETIPPAAPQAMPAAEAPSAPIAMPAPAAMAMPAAPEPAAASAAPAGAIPLGAPPAQPTPAPQAPPVQSQGQTPPAQGQAAPPRSFVMTLLAQGPVASTTSVPTPIDAAGAEALRAKSKELQAANQLGPAMQALGEALKRAPGDAASYAQMGSLLLAGRAWEDAAHHFLLAYMLAPREPGYGRMTLHTAWALGYVAWAYQLAQALYRAQPTPDLAEIGRHSQAWLQAKAPAHTQLCPGCRATGIAAQPGPCPRCGKQAMGAPANAIGFAGLKLLRQDGPSGRLFVGALCCNCGKDTPVLVTRGGPRCLSCQAPPLASL